MHQKALVALLTSALLPFAAGCEEETTPARTSGDLQVTYRVGSGSSTCEDVGIAFVRIYLGISETEDLLDRIFPCEPDAQAVTFTDVEVGTYTIRAEGLDSASNLIYGGAIAAPVTIVADRTNGPVNVVLDQLRPAIEVFFGFNEVGGCDRFGVVDILVRLYENGSSLIHDQSYDCATQITHSLLIENLSETSNFDLRVRGMNAFGEGAYEYNRDGITVAPGVPTPVSAEMTLCTGLCTEP